MKFVFTVECLGFFTPKEFTVSIRADSFGEAIGSADALVKDMVKGYPDNQVEKRKIFLVSVENF